MALIELAESAPRMFKGLFNSLVTFSITVIQDKELTDVARQNALELMATFADHAPAMCKKDPSYTSEMVTQCLSLMTDVGADDDDAQEWSLSEDVRSHISGNEANRNSWTLTKATPNTLPESSAWIVSPTSLGERLFYLQRLAGCHA